MDNQEKFSVRPLPKRVLAIRNDECAPPMNLYMQKYISADNEIRLAKDLLIHSMYEPVTVMITRAVFYTYMGLRSVFSFVVFFRSLYSNLTTAFGRTALKTWFLEAIQQREYLHYNCLNGDKENQDSLIALINGVLNDRLVDKADCVTYLSSPTLKALNIIPCTARFDRRCERLKLAPMYQQNKTAVSKTYNVTLVKKVIHHYILNTMELDNAKFGYATIPLAIVDEYNKLFGSYLVDDDKLDINVILDIMLDLFMDEVQHNYTFWIELMRRSIDMDMTRLSNTADNKPARPSSQMETSIANSKSVLAELFTLKLNDASTPNTTIPCAAHFTLALLIKDDLVDLNDLIDLNALISDHTQQQQHNSWVTLLAMALFSIDDYTHALWILKKTKMNVSGSLCDWLQRMIVSRTTAWLKDQTATKTITTTTTLTTPSAIKTIRKSVINRNEKRRSSPLTQVSLSCDIYHVDSDTDDEHITNNDYDDQHVDLCMISPARTEESFESTTTILNTVADDNTIYDDDDEGDTNKAFDYFSADFFYHHSVTSITAFQLLTDFIEPCMVSIGGTQMAASPNTMNSIILLLQHAIRHTHQPQKRTYLRQLITAYVFPVLSFTALDNLHECLQLLPTDERLDIYLRWLDDVSDDTLRAYRDQAVEDMEELLDTISTSSPSSSQIENNSFSVLAQHHPIDMAQVILDRIGTMNTDDLKNTSIMPVTAYIVRGEHSLVRDGLFGLLAHKLRAFDDIAKQTSENPSSIPAPMASLCQFARYLLNSLQLPSAALYSYLTNSSLLKSGLLTPHSCGLDSNTLRRPLTKKRNASVLGTSYLTNKKSFQRHSP